MHDIVICETDPTLRDVLCFLLEDEGCLTTTCASSSDLLLHLRQRALPATVLFDYVEQGKRSDDAVLRSLVNDPILLRAHRYILMTTNPLSEVTLALVQRLHIAILSKPFEIDDFLTLIRQAPQDDAPIVA